MGWKSRKLWIALVVMIFTMILPVVYSKMAISESITMVVLAVIGSVGMVYGGLNVLDSKYGKKE